jgi:hypothetical protein
MRQRGLVRLFVRRRNAEALLSEPSGILLLVDGLFGASMAITPLECRQLINRGWTLVGSSSIGALRASELWNAGMLGVGRVYQLLRLGLIQSDADVAVAYHPDDWREVTVSMVQVYALVQCLERRHDLHVAGSALIGAARSIYWLERSWASLWAAWQALGGSDDVLGAARCLAKDETAHPKKRDACEAMELITGGIRAITAHGEICKS